MNKPLFRTTTWMFALAVGAFSASSASAATYYIDFAGGSNANTGTSKSTPWKHAPGMQGCSGQCASKTPQPEDRFIFKGGVRWDYTCFQLNIAWNGAAGRPIYYGIDETWYTGSSWARPVFDGGHTRLASGSGIISIAIKNHITIEGIEIKGHTAYQNYGPASIQLTCTTNVLLTRLYVHDWFLDSGVGSDDAHGGILGNNWAGCNPVGTVIDRSVISNTEARDAGRQNGVAVRSVDIQYSVIHDVSTAQLFGRVHSSRIYNVSYPAGNRSFDSNYHTNVTYIQGWNGDADPAKEPAYIYNNVIYDFAAGSGGLYLNVCGNSTNASYVWNNVVYNNYSNGNSNVQIEPYYGSSGCGAFYIWNNTLHVPATIGSSAIRVVNRGFALGTVVTRNNHYIVNNGNYFWTPVGINNRVDGNNAGQTVAEASAQGLTPSQGFAFAPPSSSAATVGAGANLTSTCSGALSSLCTDTGYGVTLDPVRNAVIVGRAPLARPASGAWDAGAYHFGGTPGAPPPAQPTPPNPASSLSAVVSQD